MHSSRIVPPRRFRVRLALIRTFRCDLPEARCLTFPDAVKRKRFLVPLWVFILWDIRSPSFSVTQLESRIVRGNDRDLKGFLTKLENSSVERSSNRWWRREWLIPRNFLVDYGHLFQLSGKQFADNQNSDDSGCLFGKFFQERWT